MHRSLSEDHQLVDVSLRERKSFVTCKELDSTSQGYVFVHAKVPPSPPGQYKVSTGRYIEQFTKPVRVTKFPNGQKNECMFSVPFSAVIIQCSAFFEASEHQRR